MRISDWSSDVCSSDLSLKARITSRFQLGASLLLSHNVLPLTVSALRSMTDSSSRITAGKRSEEHTSELQSLMRISYAVFCLKKKKKKKLTNKQKKCVKQKYRTSK